MKKTHRWGYDEVVVVRVRCPYCGKETEMEFLLAPDVGDTETCPSCEKEFEFGVPK
jgi:hypothetical protein